MLNIPSHLITLTYCIGTLIYQFHGGPLGSICPIERGLRVVSESIEGFVLTSFCLMTVMVHFVAKAAIAPKAASQGANIVPTIPAQTGISKRALPLSSLTMILDTSLS